MRRRPHPYPQDGTQPGDRRDDHGGRRGADGAIHNATGVRVRDYPITLDKLLNRLPDVG
jgi:hypothetical protein